MNGCGCADCQAFYHTLDLSKYGDRVKRHGDFISIEAGKAGADLIDSNRDYWDNTSQVFFTGGRGYALDSELKTVDIGREADILKAFATGEIANDLCPGPAEVLQGILEYRKEVKDDGKSIELQRPGAFRSRATGKAKRGATHIKPASFRKRLPGNPSKR